MHTDADGRRVSLHLLGLSRRSRRRRARRPSGSGCAPAGARAASTMVENAGRRRLPDQLGAGQRPGRGRVGRPAAHRPRAGRVRRRARRVDAAFRDLLSSRQPYYVRKADTDVFDGDPARPRRRRPAGLRPPAGPAPRARWSATTTIAAMAAAGLVGPRGRPSRPRRRRPRARRRARRANWACSAPARRTTTAPTSRPPIGACLTDPEVYERLLALPAALAPIRTEPVGARGVPMPSVRGTGRADDDGQLGSCATTCRRGCSPARRRGWRPSTARAATASPTSTGRRRRAGAPWAHNTVGAIAHLALHRWWSLPRAHRTPDEGAALVERNWQHHRLPRRRSSATGPAPPRPQWVRDYLDRHVDPADEPVGVERTVATRTERLAVSGRVDRIDERGDELVVVDYKTGRRGAHRPTTPAARRRSRSTSSASRRTLRRTCRRVELHHLPTGTVAAVRAHRRVAGPAPAARRGHRAPTSSPPPTPWPPAPTPTTSSRPRPSPGCAGATSGSSAPRGVPPPASSRLGRARRTRLSTSRVARPSAGVLCWGGRTDANRKRDTDDALPGGQPGHERGRGRVPHRHRRRDPAGARARRGRVRELAAHRRRGAFRRARPRRRALRRAPRRARRDHHPRDGQAHQGGQGRARCWWPTSTATTPKRARACSPTSR